MEVRREKKTGGVLFGEKGRVELKVQSARGTWVAGQQCWLDVGIRNEGGKKVSLSAFFLFAGAKRFVRVESS